MLTRSERDEVQEALAVALMDFGNPKSLIRLIFGQEATPILRPATSILPDEIADLTANACLKSRLSLFPDSVSRSALDELRSADSDTFARAFLVLCEIWPYRILFVTAPYGRAGSN